MTECIVAGERLVLLPEKVAYWPAGRALFVADFHLGKAASFRSAGIPLPSGTTSENVERLGRAIDKTGAAEVIFLGDFLHSAEARAEKTLSRFASWREGRKELRLTLVRGNHDRKAGDPPEAWGMRCVEAGERLGTFVLNHEPGPSRTGGYALAGHIHPAVRLSASGESLRLPCFWFGARCGVLPAFGAFTGSADVQPRRGDQVFVVAEQEVLKVA
ncbi:MAG TPA: ligase-associated DNA damage response endonuclease PdeM [Usitatibacter sp.]|jgi:DNA ligase-associated metallophosphoesterase|nr:ligase-associated DNA damage response endonuclease PdeM [Usitatibacter sp.]